MRMSKTNEFIPISCSSIPPISSSIKDTITKTLTNSMIITTSLVLSSTKMYSHRSNFLVNYSLIQNLLTFAKLSKIIMK